MWEIEHQKFKQRAAYTNTYQYYIDEYGEVDGKLKYEDQIQRRKQNQSKQKMINKLLSDGVHPNEILSKIEKRWSHTSIDAFVSKYGSELGIKKYKEFVQKQKENNPMCHEYYISRGIDIHERYKYIQKRFSKTNADCNRFSKASFMAIDPITQMIKGNGVTDICLSGVDEMKIVLTEEEHETSKNFFYSYDFTYPEINTIIEYHGMLYHDDVDYSKIDNVDISYFKDNFNRDLFRFWVAKQRGYDIYVVRDDRIKEDVKYIIETLSKRGIL